MWVCGCVGICGWVGVYLKDRRVLAITQLTIIYTNEQHLNLWTFVLFMSINYCINIVIKC